MKIKEILPQEQVFTEVLGGIAHMPKMLYIRGNLPAERPRTVVIVGSRRPSEYGREVAYQLAYELAAAGVAVVSGLALGIDAVVHRAALDAGGCTVAVLGTAIDRLSPGANRGLGEEIVEKGAVVSEYAPGEAVQPRLGVVWRNRIVAGLADAVVVVEAMMRSGSLHTARFALAAGRRLYAVPGQITSVLSAGCNSLIRDGARPVVDVMETVAELAGVRAVQLELGSGGVGGSGVRGDGASRVEAMNGTGTVERLQELTRREIGRF
jgi:DNA processing protein